MELIQGNKYMYINTIKVGRACKRVKKQLTVIYVGTEENKAVFQTETGTEILLHTDDVEKFISQ